MSLLRKGVLVRRVGFPVFKPTGLAPQKVVEVSTPNLSGFNSPLRDTYQRKVFYDGSNFFVIYWEADDKQVKYVASATGLQGSWASPTVLWTFSVAPYYGGNVDVCYPNRGSKDANGEDIDLAMHFTGSNGATAQWRPFIISNQTLVAKTGGALAGLSEAQGGTIVSNLNGTYDYITYHRNEAANFLETQRSPANKDDTDSTVPHGGSTTGGNQLLPYKTISPYKMLALAKGGDNKLYYNILNEPTATFINGFTPFVTLKAGFSDFCACSEVQNIGDPERIHLVYIKSTGELCYRKYENDLWNDEKILVSSGASYPVIASGTNGKLYVFYVKAGKIWVIHFDGGKWFRPVALFAKEHSYNNPSYLSSNQNVQSKRICVVWVEGTSSPYAVWFCYLEE